MSVKKIIILNTKPAKFGEHTDELTPDMFVSSLPVQHSHSYYENDDLGLYIGVWDTTEMIETPAPYADDEFMTIIEGAVEIKNNNTGKIETVLADESFVIPRGYDCQWHQQGYLRKFYIISAHPDEEMPAKPVVESIVYVNDKRNKAFTMTSDGHHKKELYVDHYKRFSAGIWYCNILNTPLMEYPDNEFLLINSGVLIAIDEDANEQIFKQGDALFIPQGALYKWRVTNNVTITYAKIKGKPV
ncbi:MAG: hypothetical protein COB35_12555 [Gammaproteobacteria bacterium]|nr:MAG: hypothetical protein COB35_12555 [Gammaproteobacteria bacterium]